MALNETLLHDITAEDLLTDSFKDAMSKMHTYLIPVIVVVGIITNLLSIAVFTTTHLKLQAYNVYLTSLAVADTGYLLALFIGWFGWVDIHLFHRPFWCQMVVYVTYVCSFVSVWNVASFTIERYIIVCHPFNRSVSGNMHSSLIVVGSEAVFATLLYSFSLWTSHVMYIEEQSFCSTPSTYIDVVRIMSYIDTVITLIVPSLIIVLLNIKLYVTVYQLLRQPPDQPPAQSTTELTAVGVNAAIISAATGRGSDESRSSQNSSTSQRSHLCPQVRTTRMLLIVSTNLLYLL